MTGRSESDWLIFSAWFTRLGNTKDPPLSILCEVSCSTSRTLVDSYFHITVSFVKTKEIVMIYFQKGVLQPERHIFHLLKIIKYSRKIFSTPLPLTLQLSFFVSTAPRVLSKRQIKLPHMKALSL